MRLILSPVGTSILTNQAGEKRSILNEFANASRQDTPDEIVKLIGEIKERAIKTLYDADIQRLRRNSAELNGIFGLYGGQLPQQSNDTHVLVATDTFQGQTTSEIVRIFLKNHFPNTQVFTPTGLSTKNKSAFQNGIKELLKWCDETLKGYQESEYEIIFNLTGGFKSLQGYLNTIGMFYASRIVYIFEQSHELINIPRFPIKLEFELFEKWATLFLRLAHTNEGIRSKELADIPEVMLEEYESGQYLLSDWGQLAWNSAKDVILGKQLVDLPMIEYLDSFKRDFRLIHRTRDKVKLQETLAKASCLLEEKNGDIACLKGGRGGGILYDNYSGKNNNLGHFRIGEGLRVSCEYDKRVLHLRHYGKHDYVNGNP